MIYELRETSPFVYISPLNPAAVLPNYRISARSDA
nr:MAG TPA: hypothetical protein [Caudoviricetes sp.]